MRIVIDIDEEVYKHMLKTKSVPDMLGIDAVNTINAVKNGIPVNADTLAHMLMNERIYGSIERDVYYEEPVIEDVKCRLELSIIDHRHCYCGAELRETWRDRK